ncbi:MAG: hypothetical protein CM1200mP18_11050 [Gammaproteobacteria bacterium]|nr:MAG: hypothetical protein CM1200mP18_11050 [Gammaproteobacteria bacterium]
MEYRSGYRWVGLEPSSVVVGDSLFNFMRGVHDEWAIRAMGSFRALPRPGETVHPGSPALTQTAVPSLNVPSCLAFTLPAILIIPQFELAIDYK